jgi:hypothetical protein
MTIGDKHYKEIYDRERLCSGTGKVFLRKLKQSKSKFEDGGEEQGHSRLFPMGVG